MSPLNESQDSLLRRVVMEFTYLVIIVVVGVIGVIFVYYLQRELDDIRLIRSVETRPKSPNDNQTATSHVVDLLEEAKQKLEIFDDGDNFDESPYNSDVFTEAVQAKLQGSPDFEILCLFNRNEPGLKFIQQFKDNEQVKIYRRKDGSRPPDRHYKIIDGGKKAYLSEHDLGDHERTYKEISCSGFSEDIVARIDALLFQDLRQDLNKFELVGV